MSNKGAVIGVDIGGTKTQLGQRRGARLDVFSRFPTPQDPDEAVAGIAEAITEEGGAGGGSRAPGAVGIGCPGPLDQERGLVLSPPNLPQWHSFPLAERLGRACRCPVFLENDANAGALGEALFGSGKGCEKVFYVTISTGIGAGIVLDGRIYRGHAGMAGELWAFRPELFAPREAGSPRVGAANGNILDLASGAGIVRRVERLLEDEPADSSGVVPERVGQDEADRDDPVSAAARDFFPDGRVSSEAVFDAYERGYPPIVEIVESAQRILSAAAVFVLTTLAPDVIVLGGGLCREPGWYVRPIQRLVRESVPMEELRSVPIVRARLWDTAVLHGALSLAETSGGR